MTGNVGIWLDLDEAIIIDNENKIMEKILSRIDHFQFKGGVKGKNTIWGKG